MGSIMIHFAQLKGKHRRCFKVVHNKPKGINMNLSLDMLNPDTLDRLCHLQTNVKQLENTASDHHKKLKVLIKQMKVRLIVRKVQH